MLQRDVVRIGMLLGLCLVWTPAWPARAREKLGSQELPQSKELTLPKELTQAEELAGVSGLQGARLWRSAASLFLQVESTDQAGEVQLPRIAAPLRTLAWQRALDSQAIPAATPATLSVVPEQETWSVRWSDRPAEANVIRLEFDAVPLLLSELTPVTSAADGSFMLAAHLATTLGEKIRYEPQSFKNTVGYWVGRQDTAMWTIELAKAGKFNVAVLQGCGAGQGGSQAVLEFRFLGGEQVSVHGASGDSPTDSDSSQAPTSDPQVEFEVLETGHFQNFQWRHLSVVELQMPGRYEVRIRPLNIKHAALMDVRAVHLSPLP